MDIKFSVIVPVYNGGKTLGRCLDSLLAQNRRDVEILVIDDGSTDESPAIARRYAAENSAVIPLSQPHGGVSRARNRGMEAARGKYITFVDCDDFVVPDYFSRLAQAPHSDLLVFARQCMGDDEPEDADFFAQLAKESTPSGQLEKLLASRKLMPPWNKRFCRELLLETGLRFLEDMDTAEDFCFCFAYALRCGSIEILPQALYCVDLSNGDSLSRRYRPRLEETMTRAFRYCAQADSRDRFGGTLDWLFVKALPGCIAEEFKARDLRYRKDRFRIRQICHAFRQPLSPKRQGFFHRAVRLLAQTWDFPVYLAARVLKGRHFENRRKRS